MSSDHSAFEAALGQLRQRQGQSQHYDALLALEQDARVLARDYPDAPDLVMLIGAVLRQRFDWDAASQHYLDSSPHFPDHLVMRYEAGLVAIDSADYRRALGVLSGLGEVLERLSVRELRGFWRAAPMVGLYRQSLDAFGRWAGANPGPGNALLQARLERAAANAASAAVAGVGVVSLGENCLPWIVGQRWGLRPSGSFLSLESPFNLAQTVTDSVATLLEDGVYPLLDLQRLVASMAENGVPRPVNNHYRFDFNHEWGRRFVEHGFFRTVDRYEERIVNLRRSMTRQPVVYVHYTERDGDLARLARAVRAATVHDNYRLVIFDVWQGERAAAPPDDERTTYHRLELPRPDYVWFRPDDIDSEAGIAFEQRIQEAILAAVLEVHAGATQA